MKATLLLAASLGSGIVAGTFFSFSTFVMPALARLPAAEGAAAMQAINVAALNRWLMTVLVGTALLGIGLVLWSIRSFGEPSAKWIAGGTILYVVGVILVTGMANVPRNDALMGAPPDAAETAAYWPSYVAEWTSYNHLRTVAATLASACFVIARST